MQEKLTTLAEAIAPINDGDVVALQNMATQAAPMALVRELIRQQKRDLGLVVLVGGMAVDWLAEFRAFWGANFDQLDHVLLAMKSNNEKEFPNE